VVGGLIAKGTIGKHPASTVYKFTFSRSHHVDRPQQISEINAIARQHISQWHRDM